MDIVDIIWALHQDPGTDLNEQLANIDLEFDAGQALQLALLARWLEQGESIGGWKIGMTSGANRNAMGDGIRPFGFILQSRIFESGSELSLSDLHKGQVENELALLIGKELAPGATRRDAVASVEAIIPAFEINQKRLPPGAGSGLRVADNLSNYGIVVGGSTPPVDDLSNMQVTLEQQATQSQPLQVIESVQSQGHIDDHFDSLAILSNRLHKFGHALKPGQYVITGAYGKTSFAAGTYTGQFDQGVGSVSVTLA
ncbi:MAG: hypothetical protein AAF541_21990 [Pseudomonadota bacterium]